MWEVMFWPIVACVLLPWLLVYLGLHVVQRGIIFIDIAMAQMASLGICVAVLFRLELESWTTFGIALAFTLAGAGIFSVTGKRTSQIPQEAVIGIAYVVAAAAAVLLLSRAAEGDEEIKNMNDLIRPALYQSYHEIVPVNEPSTLTPTLSLEGRGGREAPGEREFVSRSNSKRGNIDIVGPVCESGDFFALDREMPELREGDLLAIMSAGAYGFVMASNYNSRPLPAEAFVRGDKLALIRKRQTWDDLVREEVDPGW